MGNTWWHPADIKLRYVPLLILSSVPSLRNKEAELQAATNRLHEDMAVDAIG